MFTTFFAELRAAKVPVSLREYLTLLAALDRDLADKRLEEFYYLARATLVKDERNLDKYDRVFSRVFKGLGTVGEALEAAEIPEEWLRKIAERYLTPEEKAEIEAKGWDRLMDELKQRLAEQKGRHQGGNKWIGTAGTQCRPNALATGYKTPKFHTSIGQDRQPQLFRAVKVWDKREFKDSTTASKLEPRATSASRCAGFAASPHRSAPTTSLDPRRKPSAETARQGLARREKIFCAPRGTGGNAVKVLLFPRTSRGSMDWHVERAERACFPAAAGRVQAFRALS